MNREVEIGGLAKSLVLVVALMAAIFSAWASVDMQMLHAAVGLIALLIVLSPFLVLKSYDLFSPWSFVILAIAALATPQAICTSFDFPDVDTVDRMMLVGRSPSYFIYPACIYLIALSCLVFGYFGLVRQGQGEKPGLVVSRGMHTRNTVVVLGAAVLLSAVSTIFFVRLTGGFESDKISSKRTKIETLDVAGSDTQQYGHIRQLSKLSAAAFLVMYSFVLCREEQSSFFVKAALAFSFLAAIALPFYASSREQVLWVIIGALGVNYYLAKGNFLFKCGVVAAVGLVLFLVMSVLRSADSDDVYASVSFSSSFEKLVLNRNGPGLSKTSHIINHIPDTLDFKYGQTFSDWIFAPVPRAIYPDKPMIVTGPIIGTEIYGHRVAGVPPGFIAELYWNFYIPGVVFGMLFMGVVLKRLHLLFTNMQIQREMKVPVYLFAVTPVAFAVLGNSLGYGTVMRFIDFVTISSIVYFCSTSLAANTSLTPRQVPASAPSTF